MAVSTTAASKQTKTTSSKQHKRSRSGCFTCRLRRKKCDEAKPQCKACKHLGIPCEYSRPHYWSNSEQRRIRKERIKDDIRRSQLEKKATQVAHQLPPSSPPELCRSSTTPECFLDSSRRPIVHRSYSDSYTTSIDSVSPFVRDSEFYGSSPEAHNTSDYYIQSYDMSISKTCINGERSRQDSVWSYPGNLAHSPPSELEATPDLSNWYVQETHYQTSEDLFMAENADCDDYNLDSWSLAYDDIMVQEHERPLLDHFLQNVSPLLYPVLDVTRHGCADVILFALKTNQSFLHTCLSVSAMHQKASDIAYIADVQSEILEQLGLAVKGVCDALEKDVDHLMILETTLAMILFPSSVGKSKDAPSDIAWHQHFLMAQGLVERLQLQESVLHHPTLGGPVGSVDGASAMTLTAWIDILGATMRGRSPVFASTWRELNEEHQNRAIGLSDLMGCDDRLMYLISEIACLEERKIEGMPEQMLCSYIEKLGHEVGKAEPVSGSPISATSQSGALCPEQLIYNISAVFCIAARIYLCSLVPGITHDSDVMKDLIIRFTNAMEYIPGGQGGFDRSVVWPLLIAGSLSTMNSSYRDMLTVRCAALGDLAQQGSLARVQDILTSVWAHNDLVEVTGQPIVHWRDVMAQKQMDCLLL